MSRHPGRMNANGNPARILDLLETDGGWLTVEGIAYALGVNPESAHRSLFRLQQRELVEGRMVLLAAAASKHPSKYRGTGGTGYEKRSEWRFVTWGEWT